MTEDQRTITIDGWDERYEALLAAGMEEPSYGGPLRRHLDDGDLRLGDLKFDNSAAALRLWNFLLTEEDRLREARARGKKIVGTMKDLGTVPVMAYSLPNLVAFYPDGAWWIPCVMALSAGLLAIADSLGINDSFCPARAMLGAFLTEAHFPTPDLLTCSVGATCDDLSVIAQRLNGLGHEILWWEIPHRRHCEPGEDEVILPGGFTAPQGQVAFVKSQLEHVRAALEDLADGRLDEAALAAGIKQANRLRRLLAELRLAAFGARVCPMPSLEMLIAEMLAIHFCSDQDEAIVVIDTLLAEVRRRVDADAGVLPENAARIFWVNPVADLWAMNLLEECGGRVCGTDYLFCHALDEIPEDIPPMEALARMALADPMVGTSGDRAERICRDVVEFKAEGVAVCRIPGASHCAFEGRIIADMVRSRLALPVVEFEVPPLSDSMNQTLRNCIEGLVEIVKERRGRDMRRN